MRVTPKAESTADRGASAGTSETDTDQRPRPKTESALSYTEDTLYRPVSRPTFIPGDPKKAPPKSSRRSIS